MAGHQHRARVGSHEVGHQGAAGAVEVVGGIVEQKDVVTTGQYGGERGARRLAAGQGADRAIGVDPKADTLRTSSTFSERVGTDATERVVRGTQLLARVQAAVLAP